MARSPRRLVAALVAALAVLFAATALLDAMHDRVRAARTRSHRERGHALVARQQLDAAVTQYRAALSLERDDPQARRALAFTLLSLNRLNEGESHVHDLLKALPTDGPLNRALARIHVARGRSAEARAAYQRAVYGEWPAAAAEERVATRFELIEYIGLTAREEVLAELLRLKAELPAGDTAAARRVADLLLRSGAPELAAETLRTAAVAASRDVDLLAQLSDVQTNLGRYTDARATLHQALMLEPDRPHLATRLAVIERVLELDPTLPRLRLVSRTRRARLLLTAVVDQTRACEPASAAVAELRRAAAQRLRRRARADAEAAEQDLALASELWAAAAACHDSSADARALAQILGRIDPRPEPQT